jgi:hypothetical protein
LLQRDAVFAVARMAIELNLHRAIVRGAAGIKKRRRGAPAVFGFH